MVISKIMLKDFKSYKDTVEIKFGGRFNVIIGENNIGKSTIFEALLLWEKCYNESLTSNKKNFYSQSVPLYISFDELYFLRITKIVTPRIAELVSSSGTEIEAKK